MQISFKEIPLFILNAFVYAVAEKNFLESETGLKVLQSGVGEVCVFSYVEMFLNQNNLITHQSNRFGERTVSDATQHLL